MDHLAKAAEILAELEEIVDAQQTPPSGVLELQERTELLNLGIDLADTHIRLGAALDARAAVTPISRTPRQTLCRVVDYRDHTEPPCSRLEHHAGVHYNVERDVSWPR